MGDRFESGPPIGYKNLRLGVALIKSACAQAPFTSKFSKRSCAVIKIFDFYQPKIFISADAPYFLQAPIFITAQPRKDFYNRAFRSAYKKIGLNKKKKEGAERIKIFHFFAPYFSCAQRFPEGRVAHRRLGSALLFLKKNAHQKNQQNK